MKVLGVRIKQLRKESKLTMKELGSRFGLSESTISGYENGNREPNIGTLIKLADFFEVTVDYLIGRANVLKPTQEKIEIDSSKTKKEHCLEFIEKEIGKLNYLLQEGQEKACYLLLQSLIKDFDLLIEQAKLARTYECVILKVKDTIAKDVFPVLSQSTKL